MSRILNVLGAILLVLLFVLRRSFASAIGELAKPADERLRDRDLLLILGAAAVVFAAFFALSIWALVDSGYWVVAVLLVTQVAILIGAAWCRRPRP